MVTLTPERLLVGCDDQQREAITSEAAPLLVVAGAGSGKTRILTRRIAWRVLSGSARPERTLALTFTRKAAHELRTRLSALGLDFPVPAGTFHSVALSELRRRALDQGRAMPAVIDSKARLIDRVTPKTDLDRVPRRFQLSRLTSEIEWAKARRVTPETYAKAARIAGRRPQIGLDEVASIYSAYEAEKRNRFVVDLDDLLERLTDELAADPDFAAASRWRFQHLFVDELQDANPAQLALLDAWLGDSNDLFAVGDARQAIYGWNGAEADAMARFAANHRGTTTLSLTANYRSTAAIISVASAVLGDEGAHAARSERGVHPTVVGYQDGSGEAEGIAQAIAITARSGREWSECAVLARTNVQLTAIASACDHLGVPVRIGSARPFLDSPSVERILRPIARSRDSVQFREWLASLVKHSGRTPGTAKDDSPFATDEESALVGFALDYAALEPLPSGPGLIAFVREAGDPTGTRGGTPGIDLLTFHRAKGLEWESVWVIGLEDGYVPLAHAVTEAQREEEQRLLYVAMTRARDTLELSWAQSRVMNNRPVARSRSPLIEPVLRALSALPTQSVDPQRSARAGIEASRRALRRSSTP